MKRRALILTSAVAGVLTFLTAGAPAAQATQATSQLSGNWAGYAVVPANPTTSPVTGVATSFTVPSINTVTNPGIASTWAGIGGYTSSSTDLIQAGVEEDAFAPGLTSYFAWYELLPAGETAIVGCSPDPNCTVNPGDQFSVDIHETTPGLWSISMADKTANWTWSTTVSYQSSKSSAEWIQEATALVAVPLVMPQMANAVFGPGNTYTLSSGAPQAIATSSSTAVSNGTVIGVTDANGDGFEAKPSPLNGDRFQVCAYSLNSCPAPA